MDDLRHIVAAAHALGTRDILDWVATTRRGTTHSPRSIPRETRATEGDCRPTPGWDWFDVIDSDCTHARGEECRTIP